MRRLATPVTELRPLASGRDYGHRRRQIMHDDLCLDAENAVPRTRELATSALISAHAASVIAAIYLDD